MKNSTIIAALFTANFGNPKVYLHDLDAQHMRGKAEAFLKSLGEDPDAEFKLEYDIKQGKKK
jgi:hypothetical protein